MCVNFGWRTFYLGKFLVRLIKCKIKFLIKIEEVCYDRRMGICCSDWFSFGLSLGQTALLKEVVRMDTLYGLLMVGAALMIVVAIWFKLHQ